MTNPAFPVSIANTAFPSSVNPSFQSDMEGEVFDNTLTQDGHHGPAFEKALRGVLGEDYDKPLTEHRVARKKLRLPIGPAVLPPGGIKIGSVQNLQIEGEGIGSFQAHQDPKSSRYSGTTLLAIGPMEVAVDIDGCMLGHLKDVAIVGKRASEFDPESCPKDLLMVRKSQASYYGTAQHDFTIRAQLGGYWRDTAVRLGSPHWHGAQEDHYDFDLRIIGGHQVMQGNPFEHRNSTMWRRGLVCGNTAPSNNRRHKGFLKVQSVVRGIDVERTEVNLTNPYFDSCSMAMVVNGGKLDVDRGEMEACARFFVDEQAWVRDWPLIIRGMMMKGDAWRPGPNWKEALTNIYLPDLDLASWASGHLYLDNCRITSVPMRRNPKDGKLYYVENVREVDNGTGGKMHEWDWTDIPAPRIRVGNTHAESLLLRAWGYRASRGKHEAFRIVDGGFARHRSAADCTYDGQIEKDGRQIADILQYSEAA